MSRETARDHAREREQALDVAEAARETEWEHRSFAGGVYVGDWDPSLVFPYPEQAEDDRLVGEQFATEVEKYLLEHLDPDQVDADGEMPQDVIQGLIELGAFALKIPAEYGGKGFTQTNYNRVVSRVATYCASTAVWLSAHQSIGVPNPLKMFGTEEQKKRFFPRLANGELSAFGLTEPEVGSDPAQMETRAELAEDGESWILNGRKLWCTNGPIADIMVVMAATPSKLVDGREKKQITAFIVEKSSPGITMEHRCQFMGLRAIQNGLLSFDNVKVPKENILWGVGKGLKLALITLNSGRLTLPGCCSGVARLALSISRRWAGSRVQWGAPVGKHEAIADKLAFIACHSFAMDAITDYSTGLIDRGGADVRIEAAMAKLFCSRSLWRIVDETVQIRGGRGYESAPSLRARGEAPFPVERMMRDARINTIVEGTSEIMHLFLAREALDFHLQKAGALFTKKLSRKEKLKILWNCVKFYPIWMGKQYLPGGRPIPSDVPSGLRGHLKFVRSRSKRLARRTFLKMLRHGPALERRELLLGRFVEIGMELTIMSCVCARAASMVRKDAADESPVELADLFCKMARRRIDGHFKNVSSNHDRSVRQLARGILEGRFRWLETGFIDPAREVDEAAAGEPSPSEEAAPVG